jgi:hypothetical protein
VKLSDTNLDSVQLYAMLHRHTLLREIIVDVPCARLVSALPNLSDISACDWDLTEEQTVEFCHALKGLRRLRMIHLDIAGGGLRKLTSCEGRAIRDAISGKSLTHLHLSGLTTDVCFAIAYAPDGTSTFGPMRNTLRTLYTGYNSDEDSSAVGVATAWLRAMLPHTTVAGDCD